MKTGAWGVTRFWQDRGGNFGIMTAILAPVLLGVGGIAIDMTRVVQIKAEMQGHADSAVLAAATALAKKDFSHTAAKKLVAGHFAAHVAGLEPDCSAKNSPQALENAASTTITQKPQGKGGKMFELNFSTSYTVCVNPLTSLITGPSVTIAIKAATTAATESKNAFSMHLVLDQSSSMSDPVCAQRSGFNKCLKYTSTRRIDALKQAVEELVKIISKADPDEDYARLAAVGFSGEMNKHEGFSWGVKSTRDFVNGLRPGGRTNSTRAMLHAYQSLAPGNPSEPAAHAAKQNFNPKKYIIYMTDGNNNNESIDADTLTTCTNSKKGDVVVYTIAFDVEEERASKLLKACAHTTGHYFEANTAAELFAAFTEIGLRANSGAARLTN